MSDISTGSAKITVMFEEPFWIGLFEHVSDGRYEVCKITFGAEPKDYEVYEFLLKNYCRLRFSPGIVHAECLPERKINPKRMQREIKRQLSDTGVGTKAQQALKTQQEQFKLERVTRTKQQREAEKAADYERRQTKKKEKHRGH